jgi:hypothetical protein
VTPKGRTIHKAATNVRFAHGVAQDRKDIPAKLVKPVADHLRRVAAEGCRAAGYALSGPDPWPRLCSHHIDDTWRVIVAFDAEGVPVVLKIAQHTDTSDPYADIANELAIPISAAERTKPPCCEDGNHNVLDEAAIEAINDAYKRLRGSSRRRR